MNTFNAFVPDPFIDNVPFDYRYSIQDLSALTGSPPDIIRSAISTGNLKAEKTSRKYYIKKYNALKFIRLEREYWRKEYPSYKYSLSAGENGE